MIMTHFLEKMHETFDREESAKLGLVLMAFVSVLMAINYVVTGTGDTDRAIGLGAVVIVACLGVATSIYACTFPRTLFELIAVPSPMYGVLLWTIIAIGYSVSMAQALGYA